MSRALGTRNASPLGTDPRRVQNITQSMTSYVHNIAERRNFTNILFYLRPIKADLEYHGIRDHIPHRPHNAAKKLARANANVGIWHVPLHSAAHHPPAPSPPLPRTHRQGSAYRTTATRHSATHTKLI
eukprot:scaffold1324_cov117-Isochrysis_galbana.AAC.3